MSSTVLHLTVTSSALSSVAYADDATLDIRFQSGSVYRYFAVPPAIVSALITAESVGSYFNRNIRNRFRYERLA